MRLIRKLANDQVKYSFIEEGVKVMGDKKMENYFKKFEISLNEEILIEMINNYQEIYELDKGEEISFEPFSKIKINREEYLSSTIKDYKNQLEHLRKLGADTSEYPKSLEELTKWEK